MNETVTDFDKVETYKRLTLDIPAKTYEQLAELWQRSTEAGLTPPMGGIGEFVYRLGLEAAKLLNQALQATQRVQPVSNIIEVGRG